MNQQFESQSDSATHAVNPAISKGANMAETEAFAILSEQGQQAIADYFARLEAELLRRAADGGTALSAYERAETLREMRAHVFSLVAAYREIGDDEQTAVASALAQFGKAGTVSVDLRRAQARNKVARLLRKNDNLLPAVLLPALFYNVSLLLAFLSATTRVTGEVGGAMTHMTAIPIGWQVLLFLQFLCGVVNANVSKKWSLHGIFMGYAAAMGVFALLDTVFGGVNRLLLGAMGASLVPWLGCACLGILLAHIASALNRKKQAA